MFARTDEHVGDSSEGFKTTVLPAARAPISGSNANPKNTKKNYTNTISFDCKNI